MYYCGNGIAYQTPGNELNVTLLSGIERQRKEIYGSQLPDYIRNSSCS